MTTLHGRLDLPDLQPFYRAFPRLPLVSISNAQRRPMPPVNWLGTVYHGLPEDLYLRFGRLRVPFGLRQDDHTGATRGGFLDAAGGGTGVLPYDPRTVQTGFEAGFYPGPFQIAAASIADWHSRMVLTLCLRAIATMSASMASISSSEPSTSTMRSAPTSSG